MNTRKTQVNLNGGRDDLLQALEGNGIGFLLETVQRMDDASYRIEATIETAEGVKGMIGFCVSIKQIGAPGAG